MSSRSFFFSEPRKVVFTSSLHPNAVINEQAVAESALEGRRPTVTFKAT